MDVNGYNKTGITGYDTPIHFKSYVQKLVDNNLLCREALEFYGNNLDIVFIAKLNQPITWSGINAYDVRHIRDVCDLDFVAIPISIYFYENDEMVMSHQNLLLFQKQIVIDQDVLVYWDIERFEPFGSKGYGFDVINKLLWENFVKFINPHTRWWDSNQLVMQNNEQTFCQNISLTYATMRRANPNRDKNEIKKYIMENITKWCI